MSEYIKTRGGRYGKNYFIGIGAILMALTLFFSLIKGVDFIPWVTVGDAFVVSCVFLIIAGVICLLERRGK